MFRINIYHNITSSELSYCQTDLHHKLMDLSVNYLMTALTKYTNRKFLLAWPGLAWLHVHHLDVFLKQTAFQAKDKGVSTYKSSENPSQIAIYSNERNLRT